jgi:predicted N-acyltransferase
MTLELRTHESIRAIPEHDYRRLLGSDAPPFLSYTWLDALEQTGCVQPERGWLPQFISLHDAGRLVGLMPAYVKGNSEGEFVFDYSWARFAEERLGIHYYPKLIVAVPFTPATGPRLLAAQGVERGPLVRAFAEGLELVVGRLELSSAHVLFPPEAEATELSEAGMAQRSGVQFHWTNPGYASFEDFLSRFNSKRRNQIRRERREMERQHIRIEILTGKDITPEVVDSVFEFYCATVNKFFWGRQYLNRAFFEEVCSKMPEQLHVVLARVAGARRPVGGAFNLLGPRGLYGRYWGASEDRPFLHFNVCFYASIEDSIARGLERFEPGAGGEHKIARGFEPTLTHSVHLFRDRRLDRAIRDALRREREALAFEVRDARTQSGLKPMIIERDQSDAGGSAPLPRTSS